MTTGGGRGSPVINHHLVGAVGSSTTNTKITGEIYYPIFTNGTIYKTNDKVSLNIFGIKLGS